MMSGVEEATAFILAGGRSSRMGSDKALLPLGDENLLEHALRTAAEVTNRVRIVGPKEPYAKFGDVVEDIYRGCGPLAGIHAALTATDTELNLILPVDIPMMTPAFLGWLLKQAGASPELITVPEAAGGRQPLCGVYRREVREIAEAALQKGEYKIDRMFSHVPTHIISEQEILAGGFSVELFRNINTPEEYEKCRS